MGYSNAFSMIFAIFIVVVKSQKCISDQKPCKYNGELGFCCSGFCLQDASQEIGTCFNTRTSTSATNSSILVSTPVPATNCIKDRDACKGDSSMGICCSGSCFQTAGQVSGFCGPNQRQCIDDGEVCYGSGSSGFCCSTYCQQDISESHGLCGTTGQTQKPPRPRDVRRDYTNWSLLIGTPFGIIVTLLLIVIIIILVRYSRRDALSEEEIKYFVEGVMQQRSKSVSTEINSFAPENIDVDCLPYDAVKFELSECEFKIDHGHILGSGEYGVVMKGYIGSQNVAVKTVKPSADIKFLKALLSELKTMIYIGNHDTIIALIGAHTAKLRSGVVYIFFELCQLGCLEKYLRGHKKKFIPQSLKPDDCIEISMYMNVEDNSDWISTIDLVRWSSQISDGMKYLTVKKVVHGDLATRNILLMDKQHSKITDFGLSRRLYDYTNYVKKKQEPLPWRWMAVESLREMHFSSKSDVWSFGVTLWEIFSMGDLPYAGLSWSADFVQNLLLQNLRLPKPIHATDAVYSYLLECWKIEPDDRPSFVNLHEFFLTMLNSFTSTDYQEL